MYCCFRLFILLFISCILMSCVSSPPRNVDNLCVIFHQYPKWYWDAKDVERRWRVPVTVQMAIVHQESKFDGRAKPPRTKLFSIIPWFRPTTAYGYSQAVRPTWKLYKKSVNGGGFWASRDVFSDAVDFIGWYIDQTHKRTGIARDNAYDLYLAYHEGIGGYQRKSYLRKPWLIQVARKVRLRSQIYSTQLRHCNLPKKPWFY